jgi:hypothetical protein
MQPTNMQVGQVLRVGRGWIDVIIDRKVRRVSVRPDLLVRVGNHLQILKGQGIALLPANPTTTKRLQ